MERGSTSPPGVAEQAEEPRRAKKRCSAEEPSREDISKTPHNNQGVCVCLLHVSDKMPQGRGGVFRGSSSVLTPPQWALLEVKVMEHKDKLKRFALECVAGVCQGTHQKLLVMHWVRKGLSLTVFWHNVPTFLEVGLYY